MNSPKGQVFKVWKDENSYIDCLTPLTFLVLTNGCFSNTMFKSNKNCKNKRTVVPRKISLRLTRKLECLV